MIGEELSDDKLRDLINAKEDILEIVYKRCKNYCISFMRSIASGSQVMNEDFEEIYNDAILVFNKNFNKPDFKLTSKIETYISKICRNLLFNKIKAIDKLRKIVNEEKERVAANKIYDTNDPIVLNEIKREKEKKFECYDKSLKAIKESGGNCYELITFRNLKSMSIPFLTERFEYSNDDTTKNQVYRCKKKLEKLVANCINN